MTYNSKEWEIVEQRRKNLKEVQRHRIHFFLEENIKAVYKKCNKELKLSVLKKMINDLDNDNDIHPKPTS
tara:strand:+ start:365 stop:574 length:210 start_codon:yes stop_codon:yes gene_type:complete